MKIVKKPIVLLFVAALVLAQLLLTAPEVSAEVYVADPGQTVTIYLEYSDVCAIDGEISISDSSIISQYEYDQTEAGMQGLMEGGKFFLYSADQAGVAGRIGVTLTIFSGAVKGSSCTVTFRYAATTPGSTTPGGTQSVTHTVTVRTEGPVEVVPTEPTEPTPPPTKPIVYVDTSELRAQLEIAKNLKSYEYTKETWAVVLTAMEEGERALTSSRQREIDSATEQLKTALAGLVSMDYTALNEALKNASSMENHEEIAKLWSRFILALDNANALLTSGDQAAADAAAKELNEAKEALQKGLEEMGEVVIVEKEVEVEVEPTYTFCNDARHNLFLILMIVSLVVNGALLIVIALYFRAKHRRERDDTPLVEYDAAEDEVEINEDLLD